MVFDYIMLFLKEAVMLFIEMAPYVTLGVLIAGVLHVFLSKDFVARHIGGNNFYSIFKSALFGVPLPLCSCGVVPTAVYLKNSGASKSATVSFLISTPQTGVDSISAAWGMLGPLFAVFRAVAALFIGIAGGVMNLLLDYRENKDDSSAASIASDGNNHSVEIQNNEEDKYPGLIGIFRKMFHFSFFELLDDIAVNFVIGLAVAAVISIAIPDDFFAGSFLSNPVVSMLLMIAIGIPMYICSTSSIPIAVAMIAKGISPGAAYVFLVAGPATNAASLAIITKALGFKTTVRYLVSIIAGSFAFGFLMDFVYNQLGVPPFGGAEHHFHGEHTPGIFMIAVSVFFLIMLSVVLLRRVVRKKTAEKEGNISASQKEDFMTRINIEGMTCGHCSANVEKALSLVKGINKIDVSLEGKYALIDGDFSIEQAEEAVKNAGYEVTGRKTE